MTTREISLTLSPTQMSAFQKLRVFFEAVKNDLVSMAELDGEPEPEIRREAVWNLYNREPPKGVIRPLQQFRSRMESSEHYEILEEHGVFELWIDDPDDEWRYAFDNRIYQEREYVNRHYDDEDGKTFHDVVNTFPFMEQVSAKLAEVERKIELLNRLTGKVPAAQESPPETVPAPVSSNVPFFQRMEADRQAAAARKREKERQKASRPPAGIIPRVNE